MSLPPIRIASRASALALWQAHHVADLLRRVAPDRTVEILHVSTAGDRNQAVALSTFGGFGVFTREVQKAVLEEQADLAVHSLKDLPTEPTPGLVLAAVPEREIVADAVVLPQGATPIGGLADLPPNARIGTGSLRRRAQLLHVRPDLDLAEVRGNVDTRLRKLDSGEYAALVLAGAGLVRLGLSARISLRLGPPTMLAAVGQGALGLECRAADTGLQGVLSLLNDRTAEARVKAERSLLFTLRAGCHAPVGVDTQLQGDRLRLEAVVLSHDGQQRIHATGEAPAGDAVMLGQAVAQTLLDQGAQQLMSPS